MSFKDWNEDDKKAIVSYIETEYFLIKKSSISYIAAATLFGLISLLGGGITLYKSALASAEEVLKNDVAMAAKNRILLMEESSRSSLATIQSTSDKAQNILEAASTKLKELNLGNFKDINASSISLIDKDGRKRIFMGYADDNSSLISVKNTSEKPSTYIYETKTGDAVLQLNDNDGKPRMRFITNPVLSGGDSSLLILNNKGEIQASLAVGYASGGKLELLNGSDSLALYSSDYEINPDWKPASGKGKISLWDLASEPLMNKGPNMAIKRRNVVSNRFP